jgi:exopolyphosphatase/guanosine-5'-triphosphate,3'-diphosphate pyrophosphatase
MNANPAPTVPGRYGLVDMGSHAIRLQIVEVGADGGYTVLQSGREPVRLGQDLFRTGSIPVLAIERAADVLTRFAEDCDRHGVGQIHAIATAAAREATNRSELLDRIERASGISVEVISGEQEARLLLRAVEGRIDLRKGRTLVADVGGGSVELLVIDQGSLLAAESLPFGALWLRQAVHATGARDDDLASHRQQLAQLQHRAEPLLEGGLIDRYAVTGGGSDTLAALLRRGDKAQRLDRVESYGIPALEEQVEQLAGMSVDERRKIPELPRDRADTIVAGGMIYLCLGAMIRARNLLVPGVGLRDGLLRQVCGGGGHG